MAASALRIPLCSELVWHFEDDAEPSKSFERPLTELVTCPLTAPKVLAARPILLLSKAGAGEL